MSEETAQKKMLPQPNIDVAFATARLVRSEQYYHSDALLNSLTL